MNAVHNRLLVVEAQQCVRVCVWGGGEEGVATAASLHLSTAYS